MKNRDALMQFLVVSAIGAGLTAAMLGVYAVIGLFTLNVLWGALLGYVLSALNFFFVTVSISNMIDRANETGDTGRLAGQIQASGAVRLLVLLGLYAVAFIFTPVDRLAALIPLILYNISIRLYGFFHKEKGDEEGK